MVDTWFVYAILCSNESVYIGIAKDLLNRWEQHKKGRGARWTKKYPPVALIYFEDADSHYEAAKRERELKKKGRKMLKQIAQGGGPRLLSTWTEADEPVEKLLKMIKGSLKPAEESITRTSRKRKT
jgi:putative endonuclease